MHKAVHTSTSHQRIAALAFEIELEIKSGDNKDETRSAPSRIRVLPDGEFDAVDGRPGNVEGVKAKKWLMNAKAAQEVIAGFTARGLKLVIDYDHQTLRAETNGQPAPAAGWITALEYVAGKGLIASVDWTEDGGEAVAGREYIYLSPVFYYDKVTGAVTHLHSVALTNTPALNTLGEIAALAARADLLTHPPTKKDNDMDKTKILVALGLPLDTGDDTALTALSVLSAAAKTREAEIAVLKANQFDAAKHIPLEEHKKVTAELATLKEAHDKSAHEALLKAALADACILPANEVYWRAQPFAALSEFLKDAKPLAVLSGTQTGGTAPAGAGGAALAAEELAVCKSLGITPEAFAKSKAEAAA
jgi:phage I-like protein